MGDEVQAPVDGFVTGAGGVPIAYRDYGGPGRGLVLLHGIGGNIEAMDHFARRLGASHRVVSIDVRFNGQSGEADRFRYPDCVGDVEAIAAELDLGEVDVVGHSLGGVIAGHYGARHPGARVVSIDGFGPGMTGEGTAEDAAAVAEFADQARARLFAFVPLPEEGDLAWKESQAQVTSQIMTMVGYAAANLDAVVERYFVTRPDGTFRRHPTRQLAEDWLDDWSSSASRNILQPFRDCAGATLLIRCTETVWPAVLDAELDRLAADRPNAAIVRLAATHFAPWWSAFDQTMVEIEKFLANTADS
ncbi:alpha/beta hydrolase [Actinokineospora sp.]|uniref:alpha/beta hydrolase n=1 Tax=Actinokineospora sp. TaxID=1872133 RepID=UPI004037C879